MFETLPLGLAKCGVLLKLNDSMRNCIWNRSVSRNWRWMPKSQLISPGPRRDRKPAVPKRGSVTDAKANGSKNDVFRPTLPNFSTVGFTWSARWVELGSAREVPEAVTENGVPV